MTSSVLEIKEVVEEDFVFVNLLSIALVFVIILASFRSLSVPIILVLCIELSIWINMAIPYIQGGSLIFIGYMIVSSIQLGATIDYGILFTQRYLEARVSMNRADAIKDSLNNSGHSILTSSLILTASGYSLKFFSSVQGVAALGELIGRGAALSGVLVIILLPQLLYLFDKIILKTSLKLKFKSEKELVIDGDNVKQIKQKGLEQIHKSEAIKSEIIDHVDNDENTISKPKNSSDKETEKIIRKLIKKINKKK